MSHFEERYVKQSQKNRRCVGCDNFVTIAKGDSYWACWYADGGDAGRYAMCEPCHDHVQDCKECKEAWADESPGGIHECRKEQTLNATKQLQAVTP